MIRPPARRRLARVVLAVLVALHAGLFWLYALREAQSAHIATYVSARERWREGALDEAADGYARYVAEYARATRPFRVRRDYPSEASAWFALGRVEAERGRTAAALAAYERAMALEPGRGRREYRDLLLESGRYAEFDAFARRAVAAAPDSAVAWWDVGAARLALGDPRGAATAYRTALERLPALLARLGTGPRPGELTREEADLLNLLAVAELEAGDPASAQATCDALDARQPRGAALDRLCRAYLLGAAGDRDAAAERLRGYQPPAPEHDALVRRLRDRLGAGAGGPPGYVAPPGRA